MWMEPPERYDLNPESGCSKPIRTTWIKLTMRSSKHQKRSHPHDATLRDAATAEHLNSLEDTLLPCSRDAMLYSMLLPWTELLELSNYPPSIAYGLRKHGLLIQPDARNGSTVPQVVEKKIHASSTNPKL